MSVRHARPEDHGAIAALLAAAFGGAGEARLVVALRAEGDAVVELVAADAGRVIGHVMLSRLARPEGWLALAPLAVAPEHRHRGVGGALTSEALAMARSGGWTAAVVVGDQGYYRRFGFASAGRLVSPYPAEVTGVLALGEAAPAAAPRLVYPSAFAEV